MLEVTECPESLRWEKKFLRKANGGLQDKLLVPIRDAIQTREFSKLKVFSPDITFYWLGGCLGGDAGWKELPFEGMSQFLLKNSKGSKIHVFRDPKIKRDTVAGSIYTLIESKGWELGSGYKGPYLGFPFTLDELEDRWYWRGVCDSALRPSDFGQ